MVVGKAVSLKSPTQRSKSRETLAANPYISMYNKSYNFNCVFKVHFLIYEQYTILQIVNMNGVKIKMICAVSTGASYTYFN